jgi:hypothetical protein
MSAYKYNRGTDTVEPIKMHEPKSMEKMIKSARYQLGEAIDCFDTNRFAAITLIRFALETLEEVQEEIE